MDYAEIVKLSRLYDLQAVYRDQTVTAGSIIFQRMFDGGVATIPENASGLQAFIGAFPYREQGLIDAHDAAAAGGAKAAD